MTRDEHLRGLAEAEYTLGSATLSLAASLSSASRVQLRRSVLGPDHGRDPLNVGRPRLLPVAVRLDL
ncbi:MAG: hypothetical protein AAFQ43_10235 [Bacteroidota bacterium]